MAALSPSGNHIAIVATMAGQRKVVVLDAARKETFEAPIDAQAKVRRLEWAGDQAVLIHSSATVGLYAGFTTSKAELGSVLVLPLDGSKSWAVFADEQDITGGVWGSYGVIEKNGRWFGYFGGVTLQRSSLGFDKVLPESTLHPDLYEVDLQTRKIRKIANRIRGDDEWRSWLINDHGEVGAVLDFADYRGQWTLTNGKGLKLASGTDLLGNVGLIGFTPDGRGVVYRLRDTDAERDTWFSVPLAGGAPQPYLDGVTIRRSFVDRGHKLIGYIEDNATGDGHFFDPRQDRIYKAGQRAFPGKRVVLSDIDGAFDRLLVVTEGPGDPETWWLIDMGTHRADPVGNSYALDSDEVGPMKMVRYSAADGMVMEGLLTLPPGRMAKALPAVIVPHDGPASYNTVGFSWIAQAFASRGYAVFQPNFRGSAGYGAAFQIAGYGEWGRKMQTDLSDGLADLVQQGIVDPHRVCILGTGYGGYAALAGVTVQHGIYRCAVAVAGISDLDREITDETQASLDDRMLLRILKREIGKGRDLKAVSPIRFADKVDVPVLFIHGKDDTVVNFAQSSAMVSALRSAGKPVDFVVLKGEDHWLSKGETRLQMLQASVDFVTKHNPPDLPPAGPAVPGPTKAP